MRRFTQIVDSYPGPLLTMSSLDALNRLAASLAKLPGVGRKSAERMAIALARDPTGVLGGLTRALQEVGDTIRSCSRCGYMTPRDQDPCRLCTDSQRDDSMLCVVEDPSAIAALERAGEFRGRYHALMGKISPMNGEGVDGIRVRDLLERVGEGEVTEVILALDTDVESDATASFLAELLNEHGVPVTRLAFGLPAGSGIGYSDPVTLARALKGRQQVS